MGLFVSESGPAGAPAVVFLHGAERDGQSWGPVVSHLRQYRCLLPDLPLHGASPQGAPFDIGRAAAAVGELIRSRAQNGTAHLVGHSLGAQVGAQLMATEPDVVDRAVLCGTIVNTAPAAWLTRLLLGSFAGMSRSVRTAQDRRHMSAGQIAQIVVASAGFRLPDGLGRSASPTLFLTGAMEFPFVRHSGAALGRSMPNGVDGSARGMGHDWPLRYPGTFARTVEAWLSDTPLPRRIVLSTPQ